MVSEANANHGPILFWCGLAAMAAHRHLWTPAAYVAAGVLAALGVLSVILRADERGGHRGSLLIATGVDPAVLRARLAAADDTIAVYRTDRATDELLDLQARYGLILVVGAEHDPRAKERVSASGLSREVPDIAEREVVVAGPRRFKRYVAGALSRLAIPRSQIHFRSGQSV